MFVTVLSFVANTVLEMTRVDSMYIALNTIRKEVCSLVFANVTDGG